MKILALDLGKFKPVSVASNGGEPKFVTLPTDRRQFTKLLQRERSERPERKSSAFRHRSGCVLLTVKAI